MGWDGSTGFFGFSDASRSLGKLYHGCYALLLLQAHKLLVQKVQGIANQLAGNSLIHRAFNFLSVTFQ